MVMAGWSQRPHVLLLEGLHQEPLPATLQTQPEGPCGQG